MMYLAIILNLAIIIALFLVFRMNILRGIKIRSKAIKYLCLAYATIYILMIPIFYLLPKDNDNRLERYNKNPAADFNNMGQSFESYAQKGVPQGFPGAEENSSESFNINEKEISIEETSADFPKTIWIERKQQDDGKIEVTSYVTPFISGNISFTHRIKPPEISCINGRLLIEYSGEQRILMNKFKYDFTTAQFKQNINSSSFQSSSFGIQAIYVKIPKSMKISSSNDYIQYVE